MPPEIAPRDHLFRALRADLVGPYHLDEEPGAPEEALHLSPSHQYLARSLRRGELRTFVVRVRRVEIFQPELDLAPHDGRVARSSGGRFGWPVEMGQDRPGRGLVRDCCQEAQSAAAARAAEHVETMRPPKQLGPWHPGCESQKLAAEQPLQVFH